MSISRECAAQNLAYATSSQSRLVLSVILKECRSVYFLGELRILSVRNTRLAVSLDCSLQRSFAIASLAPLHAFEGLKNSLLLNMNIPTIYTCNLRLNFLSDNIFLQNHQNDNSINIVSEGLLGRADFHLYDIF